VSTSRKSFSGPKKSAAITLPRVVPRSGFVGDYAWVIVVVEAIAAAHDRYPGPSSSSVKGYSYSKESIGISFINDLNIEAPASSKRGSP
jgi:hypothetical protein